MYLICLICFTNSNNEFELVLMDDKNILDIKNHEEKERIYGKLKLFNNKLYFNFEDKSFMMIENNKIIPDTLIITCDIKKNKKFTFNDLECHFDLPYFMKGKKKIKINNVQAHQIYHQSNLGNYIFCIFDHEPGYSEFPDAKIIIIDIKKMSIHKIIELGSNYCAQQCSCFIKNDKVYSIFVDFDYDCYPSGKRSLVVTLDVKGETTENYPELEINNIAKDFYVVSHENILCYHSQNKLIFYDVVTNNIVEHDYCCKLEEGYIHSFTTL